MMRDYFKKILIAQVLLFGVTVGAQVPPPPPPGGPDTESGGPGAMPENPIDMYTSALLVVSMGIIASYTYFSRKKEII